MKTTRTNIENLPEIDAELSEREMRVVSGGLTPRLAMCFAGAISAQSLGGTLMEKTQYNTSGDWDTDW
jgi:hypothetical protein